MTAGRRLTASAQRASSSPGWWVRRVAVATAALMLLWLAYGAFVYSGVPFLALHRAFLYRTYAAVGVTASEVRRHKAELGTGGFAPPVHEVTRNMVERALGLPDTVAPAYPHGKIPSAPGSHSVLYYRDGSALACFDVDFAGNVLLLRTYEVHSSSD